MGFLQSTKSWLFPSSPKSLAEPEKELRFTRSAQAHLFIILSVVFFSATVALVILSTQNWGTEKPLLEGWLLGIIPLVFCSLVFLRIGLHCVSHAYIILSPLGIEIFPFFRPEKNLQVVYWQQIDEAEISENGKELILHFSADKKSGIVASLKPISRNRWQLLKKAVFDTIDNREDKKA